MTTIEINLDYKSMVAAAKKALENGWISKSQYNEKIRYANDWKKKAMRGQWDYKGRD